VWLEVRVGNLRAMKVYEAHGYKRVGQRKDYYPSGRGQREDAVVMGLRL
jgi:ribosomal-protein-alanine N-acetyltransferase